MYTPKTNERINMLLDRIKDLKDDSDLYEFISDMIATFCFSMDGIYIVDQDGKTLMANPAFELLTGGTWEEVVSRKVTDLEAEGFFSPSVAAEVIKKKKLVSAIQTNKNGKITLTTGNPIFDEDGNVHRVISNVRDITELEHLSEELSSKKTLLENQGRIANNSERARNDSIVAESEGMKNVLNLVSKISGIDNTVMILGESGVGKGLIAQEIYRLSKRKDKPFIKLNCSAIPEQLLESELFGYQSGAFTGASRGGKVGLTEAADGGILFLDEIAEMPLTLQPKLLSFLETGEIIRIGDTRPRKLDVRIIAATNQKLENMMMDGSFRSDLYYRLNVLPVWIPPLRERREDINLLILQRVMKYNEDNHSNKHFTHKAYELLVNYSWPGNVRELINLVDRLLILSEEEIGVDDLPAEIKKSTGVKNSKVPEFDIQLPVSMPDLVVEYENKMIHKALEQGGSIRKAADLLGITSSSLFRRINK